MLEPRDQRRGQIDAGGKHQSQVRIHRHIGRLDRRHAAARLAKGDTGQPQQQRPEGDEQPEHQRDRQPRIPGESRADDQEFAHEDAERRQAGYCHDTDDERPAKPGMTFGQPPYLGDLLRALDLRDMTDGKEDRRLGQAVHDHVQQAGEVGERAAHAEGEGDDPHVLDRGIGEHALDVLTPVEHEGGEHHRHEAEGDHQRPGSERAGIRRHHALEAQHGEEGDVEQQPRKHRRDRRRAFGVRIG